jgi:hypothetical protein
MAAVRRSMPPGMDERPHPTSPIARTWQFAGQLTLLVASLVLAAATVIVMLAR